ncbi:ATP-binding cassette domain-containing protein [Streptomyces sp. YKOK-J1]
MTAPAADGASKRYRRRGPDVLDSCTFHAPAGVVCALVGPSGAGRSTLLELAAGVQRPASGSVDRPGGVHARFG